MRSLLLDQSIWDLCLDASGNIAVAGNPYAIAQDVACAIRLFQGELWYNTTPGIPYFETVLGKLPPLDFLRAQFTAAAETVPGVVSAAVPTLTLVARILGGEVVTSMTSGTGSVTFSGEGGISLVSLGA